MPEEKPEAGGYGPHPEISRIDVPGWMGAKVERPGAVDFGFFRIEKGGEYRVEGFATDAKKFTASFDGSGILQDAYFEGSSFSGHDLSIESETPVICAVAVDAFQIEIEIKAESSTNLEIPLDQQPFRILLNGTAVNLKEFYSKTKGGIRIEILKA